MKHLLTKVLVGSVAFMSVMPATTSMAATKPDAANEPMSTQPQYIKQAMEYFKKQQQLDNSHAKLQLGKNVHHEYKYTFADGSFISLTTNSITVPKGDVAGVTANADGSFSYKPEASTATLNPDSYYVGEPLETTGSAWVNNSAYTGYKFTTYGVFDYKYATPNSFTRYEHNGPSTVEAGSGWVVGPKSPYAQLVNSSTAKVGDEATFTYQWGGITWYTKDQVIELYCDYYGTTSAWWN
jgi:hypothetical protein